MTTTPQDSIHDYYKGRHVFMTGASGMLGTAYMCRLVLDTAVSHVYALVRGGESRLWKHWSDLLPSETVQKLKESQKITVWDGDITLPDYGLSADQIKTIHDNVSIIIHNASTINLGRPVSYIAPQIIQPALVLAKIALACANLTRFVFVSTAYANAFLRPQEDGTLEGGDAVIPEDLVDIRGGRSLPPSLEDELAQLVATGSTSEYEHVKYAYAYAYCKHLTERFLAHEFLKAGSQDKFTIIRPSSIGPAESQPYPFYEIPGSSPMTTLIASIIASPPKPLRVASRLPSPSTSAYDEIPVDKVVNCLVAHVAFETSGCVHAVIGANGLQSMSDTVDMASDLRSPEWGRPTLTWVDEDWASRNQFNTARLFKVLGCAFVFRRDKTDTLWGRMNQVERSNWPLDQNGIPPKAYVAGRAKAIGVLLNDLIVKRYRVPANDLGWFYESRL